MSVKYFVTLVSGKLNASFLKKIFNQIQLKEILNDLILQLEKVVNQNCSGLIVGCTSLPEC